MKGRFTSNVLANVAQFGLNIVLGLWFTPYLVRRLGPAAYGFVPLAVQMTDYLRIATLGLNAAVARFLTIALETGRKDEANRVFNTSLFGTLGLLAILVPAAVAFAVHADRLLHIPAELSGDVRRLFLCTITMFALVTAASPFEVVSYCRNRFDLRNLVLGAATLIRVMVVLALFELVLARVLYVGYGLVAAGVVSIVGAVAIWRRLTPELRAAPAGFDRGMLRQLTAMGGWSVINQVGTIMFLSIDLLVVNLLLGADSVGRYAAALQWSTMLRVLAGTVSVVFGPPLLALYASGNIAEVVRYARRAVKLMGLAVALPVALVCGLSRPLLKVWLGPEFVSLATLMSLMTAHLCINLAYLPLHGIATAANKVRWPGIASLLMGAANLGLALALAGPAGWGTLGVAAASAIVLTAKNVVFTPLYSARILDQPYYTFLRELLPIPIVTFALGAGCWALSSAVDLASWIRLAAVAAGVFAVYSAIVWFALLRPEERALVRERLQWGKAAVR